MKKIAILLSLILLTACGSSSDTHPESAIKISDIVASPDGQLWISISDPSDPSIEILEPLNNGISQSIEFEVPPSSIAFFKDDTNSERFAVQQISADYTSSQVSIGSLSDPSTTSLFLNKAKSDYTVKAYNQNLYHIGRFSIDTIESLSLSDNELTSNWNYSALNDNETGSANTYHIEHRNNQFAYLIRYGQTTVEEIDVTASDAAIFFTGNSIDLSDYIVEGASSPNAVSAKIIGSELFVLLQRQDVNFTAQEAYLAVFDISDPDNITEIDTQTSSGGLKGIKLNHRNPVGLDIQGSNIFIANRGDYGVNQGGLEVVNISNYSVTTLVDGNSFPELNTSNALFHVTDVSIIDQNTGYAALNIEEGYTTLRTELVRFDPSTLTLSGLVDLSSTK
ncbi:hypothetical protein HF888_04250 [Bermanella marisrubri]|uniref:Lipoprotein n=1 Tax=Bermanella marisrubri TaxID=207949 RepID=Q1MXS8_9GAMM|nr:hypothetical protein [Bermanella marisrubri]EAT10773.1 hypothetical protein RED65_03170 [Oceanobacter sp. RED65] [Bermanella marisrubri]QIZ83480.1 hypothetical protein HF888_04250 [Bermanella marisrubri]